MFLPYLQKFNCGGCNKQHRLTYRQWRQVIKDMESYFNIHLQASNWDIAKHRLQEKYEVRFSNSWVQRLIDKLYEK